MKTEMDEKNRPYMKFFKKLTQISSSAVRLAIGIGGALLVFLAIKDKPAYRLPAGEAGTDRSDQSKSEDKHLKKE